MARNVCSSSVRGRAADRRYDSRPPRLRRHHIRSQGCRRRAQRALKADGYNFDMGPTFLMMNFILREMFEEAGRNVEDYLRFKKLDPMYRLAFDDQDVVVSADHDKMREQIRRQFPATKAAWTGSSRKRGSDTHTSSLHSEGLFDIRFTPLLDAPAGGAVPVSHQEYLRQSRPVLQ